MSKRILDTVYKTIVIRTSAPNPPSILESDGVTDRACDHLKNELEVVFCSTNISTVIVTVFW